MFVCVCDFCLRVLYSSLQVRAVLKHRERGTNETMLRSTSVSLFFSFSFPSHSSLNSARERYLILSLSFTSGNIAHFVSFRFIALFVLLLFCCCLNNNFLNNTFRLHYFKLSYSFLFCFVCGSCCCWGLLSLFLTLLCAVFVCGNDFLFSQCVARCLCECCFTVCYTEIKRVLSLCFCCLVTSSSAFVCLLHM